MIGRMDFCTFRSCQWFPGFNLIHFSYVLFPLPLVDSLIWDATEGVWVLPPENV
jgi:hypothetical protein